MIRVAILSLSPALRSGLRALASSDERIEVIAEAATLTELQELDGLDVVLIAGTELSAPALRAAVAEAESPPAILLLSESSDAARQLSGMRLRSWGWLPPEASEEELVAAVVALHEGLLAVSPALMQPLLGAAPAAEGEELAEELTEREQDVLQLLAQGLPNKQIAMQLHISEHTVKFHGSAIYAKLGVTNRTEAVRRGARLGLIVL